MSVLSVRRLANLLRVRAFWLFVIFCLLAGAAHAGTVSIGSGDLNATCASPAGAQVWSGNFPDDSTVYLSIVSTPAGASAKLKFCNDTIGEWNPGGQQIYFGPSSSPVTDEPTWVVLVTNTAGEYNISTKRVYCAYTGSRCVESTGPSSGKRSVASQPALISTPDPNLPSTGELLNQQGYSVSATAGLKSGMQFKRVDAAGVGNQSVLDMGFIDAIDVWGGFSGSVTVCFPQHGQIIFLDAATSPRQATTLASQQVNGSTCATVTSAGTVVLVSAPATQPDAVSDCTVTATHNLNFRATPAGRRIGRVTKGSTLTVLSRTDYWFQVDSNGATGWISAGYVIKDGDCG